MHLFTRSSGEARANATEQLAENCSNLCHVRYTMVYGDSSVLLLFIVIICLRYSSSYTGKSVFSYLNVCDVVFIYSYAKDILNVMCVCARDSQFIRTASGGCDQPKKTDWDGVDGQRGTPTTLPDVSFQYDDR